MLNRLRISIISSLCLMIGSTTSLAGQRTEREMLALAQAQLESGKAATRSAASIDKLAETRLYNVYGSDQLGFVIISRDDSFRPVLAYSESRFSADQMPCGMQWWLKAITQRMETRAAKDSLKDTTKTVNVPFLCKTRWDQGDPYNFLTPVLKGEHTPTGCVATAMAQIMKYFRYPAQGKGSGYYTLSGNTNRVTENINTVYEWDKMLDTYQNVDLTDEIRRPVAQLMKDAGLATNMDYGTEGSGAFSVLAARGLARNFSYDSLAMHCYYRRYFDNEQWMRTIRQELAEGRPILYTGATGSSGHAFIFDGIDEKDNVHVNWGWGGLGDGYYDFEDLTPTDMMGHEIMGRFSTEQSMLFGFKCQESPDEGEEYTSLWCTDAGQPYTISASGRQLTINTPYLGNYHFLWFYGQLGIAFRNLDGESKKDSLVLLGRKQEVVASLFYMTPINQTIFTNQIQPGRYQVYLASKAANESTCQPIRCGGGPICYELTIGEDGIATISDSMPMSETTAIRSSRISSRNSGNIYTLDGRYAGRDVERLSRGIYIIDGKKAVIK